MGQLTLFHFGPIDPPLYHLISSHRVDQDTILLMSKLYHIMAVIGTFRYACNGVHQVMLRDIDLRRGLRYVEHFQVSFLGLLPPMVKMIAECDFLDEFDLSSLEIIMFAASYCTPEILTRLKRRLPIVVRSAYGMTEMTASCTMLAEGYPEGSVGKLYPGCEMKKMILKSELYQDPPTEPLHVTLLNKCSEIAASFPNNVAYLVIALPTMLCLWLKIGKSLKYDFGNILESGIMTLIEKRDGDNLDYFLTFGEYKKRCLQVAAYLQEKGYQKGERIAIALPNTCEFPVFLVGSWVAGLTTSGTSVEFTHHELRVLFDICEPSVVVTEDIWLDTVLKAAQVFPSIKEIICMRTTGKRLPEGIVDMKHVWKTRPLQAYNQVPIDLVNDVCHMPFSSGTTGTPKGVMLTHMNMAYMLKTALNLNSPLRRKVRPIPKTEHRHRVDQDTILLMSKLYHIMAVIGNITVKTALFEAQNSQSYSPANSSARTFRYTCNGVHQVMLRDIDLRKGLRYVEQFQVSFLGLLPPMVKMIAECDFLDEFDLSSLEIIMFAASYCTPEILTRLKRRLPIVVRSAYGMTEMTASCTMLAEGYPKGSVGKLYPGCEMKVVCPENALELGPNQKGELCFRGYTITKGYFKQEHERGKFFDKDGFLRTGDIGHFDEEGHVFLTGRLKDLIKVGGIQVSPAELEGILMEIDDVDDCAVVGVPDDKMGEAAAAFIVKREQTVLTTEQIHKFANARLADYKQLNGGAFFVESIPRTFNGKPKRHVLQELYVQLKKKNNAGDALLKN